MKKKYLIWGAVATIGAILIYSWKKGKDTQRKKDEEKVDVDNGTPKSTNASQENTSNTKSVSENKGTTSSTSPTSAEIAVAKDYRKWANSTDALKAKWGKTSKYDLDETSSNPYNTNFLSSYQGGGGAEYVKYRESKNQNTSDADYWNMFVELGRFLGASSKSSDGVQYYELKFDTNYQLIIGLGTNKSAPFYAMKNTITNETESGVWLFKKGKGLTLIGENGKKVTNSVNIPDAFRTVTGFWFGNQYVIY
jgi:hypothetical protein